MSDIGGSGVNRSGELIELAPGVLLHECLTFDVALPVDGDGLRQGEKYLKLQATVRYSRLDRRYLVDSLTLEAHVLGPTRRGVQEPVAEVTAVDLRRVPVQRLVRDAVRAALVLDAVDPARRTSLSPPLHAFLAGGRNYGPLAPSLEEVAAVYRLAGAINEAPAKAVADTFGLQARTATNWIRRARAAGHLESEQEG